MSVKVIALDIYGTVLAIEDPENLLPPRKGLDEFFEKCKARGIRVVSASDGNTDNVKIDLEESGVDTSRFDKFYRLQEDPKEFETIIKDYTINPEELMVVGDSDKDIRGARACGARYFEVPKYIKTGAGDGLAMNEIPF